MEEMIRAGFPVDAVVEAIDPITQKRLRAIAIAYRLHVSPRLKPSPRSDSLSRRRSRRSSRTDGTSTSRHRTTDPQWSLLSNTSSDASASIGNLLATLEVDCVRQSKSQSQLSIPPRIQESPLFTSDFQTRKSEELNSLMQRPEDITMTNNIQSPPVIPLRRSSARNTNAMPRRPSAGEEPQTSVLQDAAPNSSEPPSESLPPHPISPVSRSRSASISSSTSDSSSTSGSSSTSTTTTVSTPSQRSEDVVKASNLTSKPHRARNLQHRNPSKYQLIVSPNTPLRSRIGTRSMSDVVRRMMHLFKLALSGGDHLYAARFQLLHTLRSANLQNWARIGPNPKTKWPRRRVSLPHFCIRLRPGWGKTCLSYQLDVHSPRGEKNDGNKQKDAPTPATEVPVHGMQSDNPNAAELVAPEDVDYAGQTERADVLPRATAGLSLDVEMVEPEDVDLDESKAFTSQPTSQTEMPGERSSMQSTQQPAGDASDLGKINRESTLKKSRVRGMDDYLQSYGLRRKVAVPPSRQSRLQIVQRQIEREYRRIKRRDS